MLVKTDRLIFKLLCHLYWQAITKESSIHGKLFWSSPTSGISTEKAVVLMATITGLVEPLSQIHFSPNGYGVYDMERML